MVLIEFVSGTNLWPEFLINPYVHWTNAIFMVALLTNIVCFAFPRNGHHFYKMEDD